MDLVGRILGILILTFGSICDVRKRSVPKLYTWISVLVTSVFVLGIRRTDIADCLAGLAEGIVMVVMARLTGGVIGEGDGRVFCSVGLLVGAFAGLKILLWACVIGGIYALCILVSKKGNGKTAFPFLPFMMAGYIVYEVSRG